MSDAISMPNPCVLPVFDWSISTAISQLISLCPTANLYVYLSALLLIRNNLLSPFIPHSLFDITVLEGNWFPKEFTPGNRFPKKCTLLSGTKKKNHLALGYSIVELKNTVCTILLRVSPAFCYRFITRFASAPHVFLVSTFHAISLGIPSDPRQGCRLCQLALSIADKGSKMSTNTCFERIEAILSSNWLQLSDDIVVSILLQYRAKFDIYYIYRPCEIHLKYCW